MCRDDGLVGGDDGLPGAERVQDEAPRGLKATHALHDELYLWVLDDVLEARGHAWVREALGQLEYAGHLDASHAICDDAVYSLADGAVAEKGNLHVSPIVACV